MKDVRPTSGKVVQALFNILGDVTDRSFLDLFSGTGRVSRFALERGARPVVAVETIQSRVRAIRSQLAGHTEFHVLAMDVRRAVDWLHRKGHRFDVVFADPPYGVGWTNSIGELLFSCGRDIIAPGGIAVVEHLCSEAIPLSGGFVLSDRRQYGDTVLSFLSAEKKEVET